MQLQFSVCYLCNRCQTPVQQAEWSIVRCSTVVEGEGQALAKNKYCSINCASHARTNPQSGGSIVRTYVRHAYIDVAFEIQHITQTYTPKDKYLVRFSTCTTHTPGRLRNTDTSAYLSKCATCRMATSITVCCDTTFPRQCRCNKSNYFLLYLCFFYRYIPLRHLPGGVYSPAQTL